MRSGMYFRHAVGSVAYVWTCALTRMDLFLARSRHRRRHVRRAGVGVPALKTISVDAVTKKYAPGPSVALHGAMTPAMPI